LEPGSLFAGKVLALDSVDSTNTRLKAMAAQGAQTGTVLLAEEQTGGRGTRGRPFLSPRGEGLYLSVLLRPDAALSDLLTLTGWVAVAVQAGIQAACGAPAEIKWLNDIYLNGRKLVGVLTELSLMGESSEVDYVVVGIGVNVSQSGETFQAQGLEKIATSLAAEGWSVERNRLAAAILNELDKLCRAFPREREGYLTEYRRHCLTLGRAVAFEEQGQTRTGVACEVDGQFGLVIDGGDGQSYTVTSGTVTLV
jgi:BirA family biotin operon repressor/biotin-[acetyl-CoA-carboxylase] ligase